MELYGVRVEHGSEGQHHDRYSYRDIFFRHARFHQDGLSGVYCILNAPEGPVRFENEEAYEIFKKIYGVDPDRLVRIVERQKYREINRHLKTCPQRKGVHGSSGYPGESFTLCGCGKMLDYHFDISAVE